MHLLNSIKVFNAIPPGVIKDNAAYVSSVIDRQALLDQGARGVLFLLSLGATDIALASVLIKESDTKTDATTLGGTPVTLKTLATLPTATDDNKVWAVYLPIAKWKEQYLQIQATNGDGSVGGYLSCLAIFDLPGNGAGNADALGVGNLAIV